MPVAIPPSTAKSGQSTPPSRRFGRARYGSSSSAGFMRSLTIEAWATVNDSVAPNEYSVPTNVVSPGRMTRIGATPANTTSD